MLVLDAWLLLLLVIGIYSRDSFTEEDAQNIFYNYRHTLEILPCRVSSRPMQ